jgi:WD40 repeat protein
MGKKNKKKTGANVVEAEEGKPKVQNSLKISEVQTPVVELSDATVATKKPPKKPEAKCVVQQGPLGEIVTFNYPVYGVHWSGKDKLCIGGGGGGKYGMANRLVLASTKKGFQTMMEFDSEQKTVWSMGTLHTPSKTLIVGHMDSITLLKFEHAKNKISRAANLPVQTNEKDPSKKFAAITPSGRIAVVAQDDNSLTCVCVKDDALVPRGDVLKGHKDRITDVSATVYAKSLRTKADQSAGVQVGGEGTYALIATASEDRTLKVWRVLNTADKADMKEVKELCSVATANVRKDTPKCLFKFCRWSPRDAVLYALSTGSGSHSYITKFAVERTGESFNLLQQVHKKITNEAVCAFSLSFDGTIIVCADNEGLVYVVDATTLAVRTRRTGLHDCPVTAIDISRNNQMIASVDLDCVMKLYACKAPGAGAKMYAVAALVVALIAILAYFLLQ